MSEFSHRTVKEIKQFLKKYNSHFRIKVTKKRKAQLLDEMREGMKKEITPELKADYEKLLETKPKAKAPAKPPVKPPTKTPAKKPVKKPEYKKIKKPDNFKEFEKMVVNSKKSEPKKDNDKSKVFDEVIAEYKKLLSEKEVKQIEKFRDEEKPLTKPLQNWLKKIEKNTIS